MNKESVVLTIKTIFYSLQLLSAVLLHVCCFKNMRFLSAGDIHNRAFYVGEGKFFLPGFGQLLVWALPGIIISCFLYPVVNCLSEEKHLFLKRLKSIVGAIYIGLIFKIIII